MVLENWKLREVLPRVNRLKKKKDFQEVMRKGKTAGRGFLVLKFKENNLPATRVGFVVSQKISKKAVTRNRVKRRLRESVKNRLADLKPGYDLIFFTKKGIEAKDFQEIKATAESLLEIAGLLMRKS